MESRGLQRERQRELDWRAAKHKHHSPVQRSLWQLRETDTVLCLRRRRRLSRSSGADLMAFPGVLGVPRIELLLAGLASVIRNVPVHIEEVVADVGIMAIARPLLRAPDAGSLYDAHAAIAKQRHHLGELLVVVPHKVILDAFLCAPEARLTSWKGTR